jgi:hypothetical protein
VPPYRKRRTAPRGVALPEFPGLGGWAAAIAHPTCARDLRARPLYTRRVRPGWTAIGLALGAAGCSFPAGDVRDGGAVDAPGGDAAGVIAWSLHTGEDFEDDGADPAGPHTFGGGVIRRDLIEPVAYTVGGLRTRASNTGVFAELGFAWSDVIAFAPTDATAIALPAFDFEQLYPGGLGINNSDSYALWSEGEIYLEAGAHTFELEVDSTAFLEIEADEVHRTDDRADTAPAPVTFSVTATGWYPIRLAFSNSTSEAFLRIFHDPPGAAPRAPLVAHRLRTLATDLTGVVRTAWDSEGLGRLRGATVFGGELVDEDYGNGEPGGMGLTSGDAYSQRFAGQVWIDAAGDYSGNVISDDGFRFALDGVWLVDELPASAQTLLLPTRALERGWHELAFDHQENGGDAHVELQQIYGDAIDQIPAALLRPVTTTRERLAIASTPPANGPRPQVPASVDVELIAPDGAELIGLTVAVDVPGAHWDGDVVDLTTPWGTTIRIRDRVDGGAAVANALTAAQLDPDAAHSPSGLWRIAVDDVEGGDEGEIARVELTARYRGGFGPIPPTAIYTSGVHDFGAPRQVSGVALRASTPAGSTATWAIRVCDALPCDGEFVTAAQLPLPAARYAQLQVTLGSDGDAAAFVDDIDVYVVP